MSSKDKRRYPRVHARNVSAHLNVADQSSPCVIQNISAGGIFIETTEALPVGMPVAVNLARPGWTKVLKLSGRVVWAMAPRTAAKKGTLPGMRIKFDALPPSIGEDLMLLLKDLGAVDSPPPMTLTEEEKPKPPKDPGAITQPVMLKDIEARVTKLDDSTGPSLRPEIPPVASTITSPAYRPSAPRSPAPSGPRIENAQAAQVQAEAIASADGPRLIIQVQGLLMQMGELQSQLEQRDREMSALRDRLKQKEEALDKSDRERKAAELALQRLAMQLSARR